MSDALALRQELMSRLGIASPLEGGDTLKPLRYDAADYLEELARSLPD
jgi:hypothetical protein